MSRGQGGAGALVSARRAQLRRSSSSAGAGQRGSGGGAGPGQLRGRDGIRARHAPLGVGGDLERLGHLDLLGCQELATRRALGA